VLLAALADGGPWAEIDGLHVAYEVGVSGGTAWTMVYVVVTCGAFLASSDSRIALVGAANFVIVSMLAWLTVSGVISLWCAWAAFTSVVIAAYLRSPPRTSRQLTPVAA
jgi:hypothetical protein